MLDGARNPGATIRDRSARLMPAVHASLDSLRGEGAARVPAAPNRESHAKAATHTMGSLADLVVLTVTRSAGPVGASVADLETDAYPTAADGASRVAGWHAFVAMIVSRIWHHLCAVAALLI